MAALGRSWLTPLGIVSHRCNNHARGLGSSACGRERQDGALQTSDARSSGTQHKEGEEEEGQGQLRTSPLSGREFHHSACLTVLDSSM